MPGMTPTPAPTPERRRPARTWSALSAATLLLVLGSGCPRRDVTTVETVTSADGRDLAKVVIQTDWYAQPEHGGFYQAQLTGIYDRAGLAVEIRQGGPNALGIERIILGEAQFAITSLAEVVMARGRDLPVIAVAAFMQRDPQAILFHEASGVKTFADLEGRRLMAGVGAAWIEVVKRKAKINFDTVPLDFGMERFLADEQFIQQCFVTSEPYFARQQGATVGTLLIAEAGFDPYRVIYCRRDFAEQNPELVKAFVAASIQGWRDYLYGDRTRTHQRLSALNPKQTPEFMAFSVGAILEYGLITGVGGSPDIIGTMTTERLAQTARDLAEIKLVPRVLSPDEFASLEYLPTRP